MSVETKIDLNKDTIEGLQQLIQVNIDSAEGFKHAAEHVESQAFQSAFRELADEREAQAEELAAYVAYNREEPQRDGSYAAALHRCWITCREALTTNNLKTLLSEAEFGEDQIKAAYEEVIKKTAGSAMNSILLKQYANVKAAHDTVRDLRDACKD